MFTSAWGGVFFLWDTKLLNETKRTCTVCIELTRLFVSYVLCIVNVFSYWTGFPLKVMYLPYAMMGFTFRDDFGQT